MSGGEFYKPTTILFVLVSGCSFQPIEIEYISFYSTKLDMNTYLTKKKKSYRRGMFLLVAQSIKPEIRFTYLFVN